jgi:putative acetyltransferase
VSIAIERVSAPTDDAAALIAELDGVLGAVYPPEQRHGLSLDQVFEPHVRFFIARVDGEVAGCGAVALFDTYAEVKRMYTRPSARRRGVGKAVLARLEKEARRAGKPMLRLETGIHQVPAIRLYEEFGFRRCGPFGDYTMLPSQRITDSVFFEKHL